MRALVIVTVMAMTLAISACGDDDSSDDAAAQETVAVDVPDVIGDSVEDAVCGLLQLRDGELGPEELQRIEQLIDDYKRQSQSK